MCFSLEEIIYFFVVRLVGFERVDIKHGRGGEVEFGKMGPEVSPSRG